MKKYLKNIPLVVFIIFVGCSESDDTIVNSKNSSFLPMSIGNYWKNDDENITKITDTLRIQGDVYYKFYSLIGGDQIGIQYLRIDDDLNLIEIYPEKPDLKYIHAKFNAEIGSTFWTRNDQTVNDFKATVIERDKSSRAFEFQRVYHPSAKDKHIRKYIRGLGYNNFKEIKIDDNIFNF